jgi:hypothetical protein
MLCTRQGGKSTVAAALALRDALLNAPALILMLSPTQRQSGELFRAKFLRLYDALGRAGVGHLLQRLEWGALADAATA